LRRGCGIDFPLGSCMQALVEHLTSPNAHFQPMNFNFGLLPRPKELPRRIDKKEFLGNQAQEAVRVWLLEAKFIKST